MPCDSRITQTAMADAERLAEAMRAEGHTNVTVSADGLRVSSSRIAFTRSAPGGAFTTRYDLGTIGKRYAELSARAWAKRAGYTVLGLEDETLTLVNRRR